MEILTPTFWALLLIKWDDCDSVLYAYLHCTAVVVITVFISSSSRIIISIIIIITIISSLFPQMTPRVYSLFKHTCSYPNRIFSSILHQGSCTLPVGREIHDSQEENPAAFSLWGAVGSSCWRKLRWGPSLSTAHTATSLLPSAVLLP